ncbi:hypothetical protein [Brevibacterium litoralis]|uniref:hypothetical protein n=1 Tax=Brevibacterium litoralis TaxID=3138935 RepID=UPI0032F035BE
MSTFAPTSTAVPGGLGGPPGSGPGGPGPHGTGQRPEPPQFPQGRQTAVRVVAATVAVIVALVVGGFTVSGFVHDLRMRADSTTRSITSAVSTLTIDAPNAVVDVSTSHSADQVSVELEYQGVGTAPVLDVAESGDPDSAAVHVSLEDQPGAGIRNIIDRQVDLNVVVPADMAAGMDLGVETRVGFSHIDGRFASAHIDTVNGAVDADIETDGALTVETRTGALTLSGRAASATLTSENGVVSVDEIAVSDTLDVTSRTGPVSVTLDPALVPVGGVTIDSDDAWVDLALPRADDYADAENAAAVPGAPDPGTPDPGDPAAGEDGDASPVRGYFVDASSDQGHVETEIDGEPAPGDGIIPVTVRAETGAVDIHHT